MVKGMCCGETKMGHFACPSALAVASCRPLPTSARTPPARPPTRSVLDASVVHVRNSSQVKFNLQSRRVTRVPKAKSKRTLKIGIPRCAPQELACRSICHASISQLCCQPHEYGRHLLASRSWCCKVPSGQTSRTSRSAPSSPS